MPNGHSRAEDSSQTDDAPCAAEPMTAHVDVGLPLAVAVALPTPVGMPNLARISAQMMAEVAKDA